MRQNRLLFAISLTAATSAAALALSHVGRSDASTAALAPAPAAQHQAAAASHAPRAGTHLQTGAGPLLGSSSDFVLSRLGVPATASADAAFLRFGYHDGAGRLHRDGVVFHDGVAIYVDPGLGSVGRTTRPPADGAYLGQSVPDLVRRLGNPVAFDAPDGGRSVQLTYPDGVTVRVAHGHVIAVE